MSSELVFSSWSLPQGKVVVVDHAYQVRAFNSGKLGDRTLRASREDFDAQEGCWDAEHNRPPSCIGSTAYLQGYYDALDRRKSDRKVRDER